MGVPGQGLLLSQRTIQLDTFPPQELHLCATRTLGEILQLQVSQVLGTINNRQENHVVFYLLYFLLQVVYQTTPDNDPTSSILVHSH
jgi:hypothetical protein